MASDPMAQDLIRCDLCPGKLRKTPVEMVCKTCSINLCKDCVGAHISAELSIKHDVVGFKFSKSEMPSVSCKLHPKSKCELHCQNCSVPVCAKCLATGSHKNHDVVEISLVYNSQKDVIKLDTEQLRTLIAPTYEKMVQDLEEQKSKRPEIYGNLRKSILKQGKGWRDEVDVIIEKNLTEAEQMEKEDLTLLSDLQSEIKSILSTIIETIRQNQIYLQSHTGNDIINYKSRNEEFRKVPVTYGLKLPTFSAMKIEGKRLSEMFGELKPSMKTEIESFTIQTPEVFTQHAPSAKKLCPREPKLHKNITISAMDICCVPNTDDLYIYFLGQIQQLDNNGKVVKTTKTASGGSSISLTVTSDGKLIYSDRDFKRINMVKGDKIDTIIRLHGWRPLAVCCTSSNELLVSMKSDDDSQSKVVRYNKTKVTQEIQFNTANEPLYKSPRYIDENKNLQVCVSDRGTMTVVVTDKAGKLVFRYNGNLTSKKYKTFDPWGIATDSDCHILVADHANKCIHIINHEGAFIMYIDNCDLRYPCDLSISHDDTLYVADYLDFEYLDGVKVIKYLQ